MKTLASILFITTLVTFLPVSSTIISTSIFTSITAADEEESKEHAAQTIVLLGDKHCYFEPKNNTPHQTQDAQHKKSIFSLLRSLAGRKEKTAILIESHPDQPVLYQPAHEAAQKRGDHIGLFCALPAHAHENNYQEGNLSYIPFDLRCAVIRTPIQFFMKVEDLIAALSTIKGTQYTLRTTPPDLRTQVLELCQNQLITDTTNQAYMTELLLLVDKTRDSSCAHALQQLAQQAQTFFAPYPPTHQVDTILFNKACTQFDDFLNDIESIFVPLNHYIGDAALELRTQEALRTFDTIVIFAGHAHNHHLNNLLSKTHGRTFHEGALMSLDDPNLHHVPGCSPQAFQQITNLLCPESAQPLCLNCAQKPGAKQCSRCKRAKYCSVACQRAHWKQHKAECST